MIALVVGVSTYDYGRSAGHYGFIVVAGVLAALLLAAKFIE
ncbi:hypothetical protein [Nocardia sp. BMG51109]|nr:hypothetical protein [Nocardia sp. BMG51109]